MTKSQLIDEIHKKRISNFTKQQIESPVVAALKEHIYDKENDMKEKGKSLFDEVISNAKDFVEKQKGVWDHAKWESFLSDIQKKGVSVTEEVSNTVGSVVESLKKLYSLVPQTEVVKEEEEVAPKEPEEKKPVESKPKKAPASKKPKAPVKKTEKSSNKKGSDI